MAVASEKGSSKRATGRGRTSSNGSSASGKARSASRARQTKQASGANRPQTGPRIRTQGASIRRGSSSSKPASNNRSNQEHGPRNTIASIGIPVVTATIGVAGGILLGRTTLQRNRKVLGVPLPTKVDFGGVTRQIGEAGRQFDNLAQEVRTVREKAEQIGRVIS